MKNKALKFLAIASLGSLALPATANAAVVVFGNSAYEFVATPGGVTWDTAFANAAASTYNGATGYLATVTSAQEEAFLKTLIGSATNVWVSGSDAGSEGTWTWRAGPEAGQTFYANGTSAGTDTGYSNWNSNPAEPNNSGGVENYLWINGSNTGGNWNDVPNGILSGFPSGGYIVEYAVPEPATWAMFLLGFGLVGFSMRRRQGTSTKVSFA